ncbi:MAG: hypothetical protein IT437_06540 [Phycisphaerales bacterium]|nr:hypothetical protein [Phycisphaerales bacterium]
MKRMIAGVLLCCGLARAQVIVQQDFEQGPGEWLCNGNAMMFPDGNPGQAIGLPFDAFWGVTLRDETPGTPLTGDLTRYHAPLQLELDINVLRLENFFQEPMDPGLFPFVLEFVDYPEPGSPDPVVSVYTVGPGLPPAATWGHFAFDVPDPSSAALPAGWGGTGDEDPKTFEPRLPANRTYASVLRNVDEVRFTTMVPGFFYTDSFWEVRIDNVKATVMGGACYPDCNGDGALNLSDFGCFTTKFALGDPYADCNGDTVLNLSDFGCFTTKFALGCP